MSSTQNKGEQRFRQALEKLRPTPKPPPTPIPTTTEEGKLLAEKIAALEKRFDDLQKKVDWTFYLVAAASFGMFLERIFSP